VLADALEHCVDEVVQHCGRWLSTHDTNAGERRGVELFSQRGKHHVGSSALPKKIRANHALISRHPRKPAVGMAEIWYRGQSSTVAPSKPGGSIHDFGDGMYLTDSREVAEQYARTRVAYGGGQPEVFTINIERGELGNVLDLNSDPRWQQFLRNPQVPGRPELTPENLIKMANENYGRFFEHFVRENKIRIKEYDAVIGPEFVRGGSQLAILHKDGRPSPLAIKIRGRLRPVDSPGRR
jgi:hypothetical protein